MNNMLFEDLRTHRHILCIDLVSFYASVECKERGLDPLTTMLVVADEARGDGAITLAATPSVKKHGIKSRGRLFEMDKKLRNQIIIAKPRMQKYVDYSLKINNIYTDLFDESDIYVYSIDECFIDITNYLTLYNSTPEKLAIAIKRKILRDVGLHVTIGYGPTMVLSKFALDIDSKHSKNQIAIWTYENFQEKLWPIKELTKVWGIGKRRAIRLNNLGIYSMEELAKFDVAVLEKEMGVIGEELILHANGIDISRVADSYQLDGHKSLGVGQTLHYDVFDDEALNIIIEMVFDTVLKLKSYNYQCHGIGLMLAFNNKSFIKPVNKHYQLERSTSNYNIIKDEFATLFWNIYPKGSGLRKISISLFGLNANNHEQLSLFDKGASRRNELDLALVKIRKKYGKSSVMTANSKFEHATGYARNKMIGGHNADDEEPK